MASARRARDLLLLGGALTIVLASTLGRRAVSGDGASTPSTSSTAQASASLPRGAELASAEVPPPHADAISGCEIADRGVGAATPLGRRAGAELALTPGALGPDGRYTLVLHLHGGLAARRLLLPEAKGYALATIDRGASSRAYEDLFPRRVDVDALLAQLDAAIAEHAGAPARADRLVLSAWSAGYAGVASALAHLGDDRLLAGVILLDGLHAPLDTSRRPDAARLAPFFLGARRALEEPRFAFLLTHSSIRTEGYASTTETADALLEVLRVRVDRLHAAPRGGLHPTRLARERGFELRGFEGEGPRDHCAQLGLLPELVPIALGAR